MSLRTSFLTNPSPNALARSIAGGNVSRHRRAIAALVSQVWDRDQQRVDHPARPPLFYREAHTHVARARWAGRYPSTDRSDGPTDQIRAMTNSRATYDYRRAWDWGADHVPLR